MFLTNLGLLYSTRLHFSNIQQNYWIEPGGFLAESHFNVRRLLLKILVVGHLLESLWFCSYSKPSHSGRQSSLWHRHCSILVTAQKLHVFSPSFCRAQWCFKHFVGENCLEDLLIPFHMSLIFPLNTLYCAELLSLFRLWKGKTDKMWHFHVFIFLVQFWLRAAETFMVLRYAAILPGFVVRQANNGHAVQSVSAMCSV